MYILLEVYKTVESVFEVIAEPNRRAILSLLVSSNSRLARSSASFGMPQPSVSKHLRVLREAGFVESRVEAQRRLYRLRPEPLHGAGRLAGSLPAVLVGARRCPGTTPGPMDQSNQPKTKRRRK